MISMLLYVTITFLASLLIIDYGKRDGGRVRITDSLKYQLSPGLQGDWQFSLAFPFQATVLNFPDAEDTTEAIKLRRRVEPSGCC